MIKRSFRKKFVRPKQPAKVKKVGPKFNQAKLTEFSTTVRARDEYRCQVCGSLTEPQAHHVLSKFYHPEFAYDTTQGITLCKRCHIGKRGVHGTSLPKNEIVERLRKLFRSTNIRMARILVQELRNNESYKRTSNNRTAVKDLPILPKTLPVRKAISRRLQISSDKRRNRKNVQPSIRRRQRPN